MANVCLYAGVIFICFGMIASLSSTLLTNYENRRIVPKAIFQQFRDEMTYPRKMFYQIIWRGEPKMKPRGMLDGKIVNVIMAIIALGFFLSLIILDIYYQASIAALGALIAIVIMLLISRFWMIRPRLFMLKEAASLKNTPRKGRKF